MKLGKVDEVPRVPPPHTKGLESSWLITHLFVCCVKLQSVVQSSSEVAGDR